MNQSELPSQAIVPDKVYERSSFKTWMRAFGALVLIVLNVALVGSDVSQLMAHQRINLPLEGATYLVAFFFDVVILRQILFEVRKISLWKDKISLDTLFWHSTIKFDEITELKPPHILAYAILKTRKVSYILNQKDFSEFKELMIKLEGKIGERTKSV